VRLPLQLAWILLLAIASVHASTLADVNVYTGGNSTPSEWAIIVVLFDSAGTVTDVSTFTDITEISVLPEGLADSYYTSSSGEGNHTGEPLADPDGLPHAGASPLVAPVPEPSTFALLALGAAALIWRRSRR